MSKYPTLERLRQDEGRYREVRAFLEWLESKGITLAQRDERSVTQRLYPITAPDEVLIYAYLGIDRLAAERERQQMERNCRDLFGTETPRSDAP